MCRPTQCTGLALFFLAFPLTAKSAIFADPLPLRTERDQKLSNILLESAFENQSLLLAERSARLNALRNQYREIFERPDFAASFSLGGAHQFTSQKQNASGVNAELHGLVQFGGDWQSQFGWFLGRSLTSNQPLDRQTSSTLPELNYALISYGRDRSVETRLGLFADRPVLAGRAAQSLFSGLSVALHPVSQKLSPESPQILLELEQGWSQIFRAAGRSQTTGSVQRTRPSLNISLKRSNWRVETNVHLEWYSDSQGILGRVVAQRPVAKPRATTQNGFSETRWRLFVSSLSGQLDQDYKRSLGFSLERVSNTIGRTSQPALSGELNFRENLFLNDNTVSAEVGLRMYEVPAGSVPAARLPLQINPGTRGRIVAFNVNWIPKTLQNQSLDIRFERISETRDTEAETFLHCHKTAAQAAALNTDSCITGVIHLIWTRKVGPNL